MKRIIGILTATLCAAVAFFYSCQPLEPDSYTRTFYRVATVKYKLGTAYLSLDCTNESYRLKNFKDTLDMQRFGVSAGDKIIALLKIEASGSIDNNVMTLEECSKIAIDELATSHPSDTLNFYYQMTQFSLGEIIYPDIWNEGHVVTVAPIYYVTSTESKAEFQLYPLDFRNDTLFLRLYSDIPDADVSYRPYLQSLLCYDISSIRKPASNPVDQEIRDSIVARLDSLQPASFYVHIVSPDSLRANNSKNPAGKYNLPYPIPPSTTTIPFDF